MAEQRSEKKWAKLVSSAVGILSSLDELSVRQDVDGAEKACIDLIAAAEAPDFKYESDVIKGVVFAETANLYTICAKVTREKSFIERGLLLYAVAAENISKGNHPLALMVVQINRGAALNCYAHLIQKSYLEKYKRDMLEVYDYLEKAVNRVESNEFHQLAQDVHDDLGIVADFNKTFSEWNNWSDLSRCSMDFLVENDVEKAF